MVGALITGGMVVGTAIASPSTPATATAAVTAQAGAPHGLLFNDKLRPHPAWTNVRVPSKKRVVRHKARVAHRSHARTALTGSPQTIAHALVLRRGWSESQWGCLDSLWMRESDWRIYAENSSGAYGIPQALPGSKMSMMGSDWRSNPITQIRWGLWYISATYGSPCNALAHSNSYGYY